MNEQHLPERSRIVQQHLISGGVDAEIRELHASTRTASDAATALSCDRGAIASSLLFIVDDQPVLVMTSGRHRVDTNLLATALSATRVEMATAKQVRQITGQAIGGVAPIGHPTPITTVIDESLGDYDEIWAAAGTPHTVVPLTFAALTSLTNGQPLRISSD